MREPTGFDVTLDADLSLELQESVPELKSSVFPAGRWDSTTPELIETAEHFLKPLNFGCSRKTLENCRVRYAKTVLQSWVDSASVETSNCIIRFLPLDTTSGMLDYQNHEGERLNRLLTGKRRYSHRLS